MDPADFASKKMSAEIINLLLTKRGEMQIGLQEKTYSWKYRILPDNTKTFRSWLVYSVKKKAIFCLHCLLFGSPNTTRRNTKYFAVDGYSLSNVHNVHRDVESHESSDYHRDSDLAVIRWNSGKSRIDRKMIETHNYWVDHHRAVVSVIIDCSRFLTKEMMAFQKADKLKGKLMNLFRLLAKYNADAKVYLEKLEKLREQGKKLRVNFLNYSSMFKLVCVMRDMVTEEICKRVTKAKYFSIIVDGTQDASKMESNVVLLRYIEGLEESWSIPSLPAPVERLLGIFTCAESTGEVLYYKTIGLLEKNNLDIRKIVGQSYDGAGNMQGTTKGMKTLVQKVCPQAIYVWCHGHRFNLVIEKSVENNQLFKNFFGILEELYVFMRGHRRHGLLVELLNDSQTKNCQKNFLGKRRLKRVVTTRWNSKHASCSTLAACYEEVVRCLDLLSKDKTATKETVTSAAGLKMQLSSFEFVATLKICITIFNILAPVTTILQSKALDFGSASRVIENVAGKLKDLRTEEAWIKLKNDILKTTTSLGIKEKDKRIQVRKRFMDENNLDAVTSYPSKTLDKFKIEIFYSMIDALNVQIEDRFNGNMLEIMKEMLIFTHENLLKNNFSTRAKKLCENYKLDADLVEKELIDFKKLYEIEHKEIDVSDLIPTPLKEKKQYAIENTQIQESDVEEILLEGDENFEEDREDQDVDEKYSDEEEEEEEGESDENKRYEFFILRGFIKPYRFLMQLSKYNNLTVMYRILVTLAVNSCSAERAFSKEKIIKNPIRSSMLDEWLSAMIILASEVDILDMLNNDAIIDRFAQKSSIYCKLLKK